MGTNDDVGSNTTGAQGAQWHGRRPLAARIPTAGPGFCRPDDQRPGLSSVPLEIRPSPSPYPRTVGVALQDTGSLQM